MIVFEVSTSPTRRGAVQQDAYDAAVTHWLIDSLPVALHGIPASQPACLPSVTTCKLLAVDSKLAQSPFFVNMDVEERVQLALRDTFRHRGFKGTEQKSAVICVLEGRRVSSGEV